jgi:hypothetical protein
MSYLDSPESINKRRAVIAESSLIVKSYLESTFGLSGSQTRLCGDSTGGRSPRGQAVRGGARPRRHPARSAPGGDLFRGLLTGFPDVHSHTRSHVDGVLPISSRFPAKSPAYLTSASSLGAHSC